MTTATIKIYKNQADTSIDIIYLSETFWLTQPQIAELYGVEPIQVAQALHSIYAERELTRSATSRSFLYFHTSGGKTTQRQSKFYNHDAIISVGYRIQSLKATHFRLWMTEELVFAIKQEAQSPKMIAQEEKLIELDVTD